MTFVGELVDRSDLPSAVGINTAVMNGSRVVGPAFGGMLISGVGVEWCFAVNIVLASAVLVSMLAVRPRPRSQDRRSDEGGLLVGFRIGWEDTILRFALLSFTYMTVFVIVFPVTLPLLAERSLNGGAGTFTLLFAALSLGSISGALLVARHSTPDSAFLGTAAVWTAVTMAALAFAPNIVVAVLVSLAVGSSTMAFMTGAITVVQLNAPPEQRGRVLALVSMIGVGSRRHRWFDHGCRDRSVRCPDRDRSRSRRLGGDRRVGARVSSPAGPVGAGGGRMRINTGSAVRQFHRSVIID